MERILSLLSLLILLPGCLCLPVSAESAASSVNLMCTVNSEGDCLATMTVNLRLEAAMEKLDFPLPLNAKNITLNNSPVSTSRGAAATLVDISKLSRDYVGELVLRFEYTIPEAVQITKVYEGTSKEAWVLLLSVPLLSGFDYPVQALEFSVTLPGTVTAKPAFISGYHQANIEKDMVWTVTGATITGTAQTELKDHETLSMRLELTEETFPRTLVEPWSAGVEDKVLAVIAVLGLLYWIIFLRSKTLLRQRRNSPPDGITAGELGVRLTFSGALLVQQRKDVGDGNTGRAAIGAVPAGSAGHAVLRLIQRTGMIDDTLLISVQWHKFRHKGDVIFRLRHIAHAGEYHPNTLKTGGIADSVAGRTLFHLHQGFLR